MKSRDKRYRDIGSWWENGTEPNELDVVAIGVEGKEVFIAEVKRQRRKFNLSFGIKIRLTIFALWTVALFQTMTIFTNNLLLHIIHCVTDDCRGGQRSQLS